MLMTAPSRPVPETHVASSGVLLPTLLSGVAGMADVIGFLSLGLFTAHVTGNLVVMSAEVVRGGPPKLAEILAVPVFIAAVAAVWLIAQISGRRGPALVRPLLTVQFLLLSCVLVFSVVFNPRADPHSATSCIAAMIAVSAMGCQFALLRVALPGTPSTGVMTGNVTTGVLSLLDTLWRKKPLFEGAQQRVGKTAAVIAGFCAGCMLGAAAVSWLGPWAWSFPAALAGLVIFRR